MEAKLLRNNSSAMDTIICIGLVCKTSKKLSKTQWIENLNAILNATRGGTWLRETRAAAFLFNWLLLAKICPGFIESENLPWFHGKPVAFQLQFFPRWGINS